MDSVSHIRVANLLMDYVEQTCGVTFDPSGFVYGNLKPDLTGTYLTKRHNPSIMMDEVMDKIRAFAEKYTIAPTNGRELSCLCRKVHDRSHERPRAIGRSRRDLPLYDRFLYLSAQR